MDASGYALTETRVPGAPTHGKAPDPFTCLLCALFGVATEREVET
jgi:hypothetical protein